jgi:hypothetical protein
VSLQRIWEIAKHPLPHPSTHLCVAPDVYEVMRVMATPAPRDVTTYAMPEIGNVFAIPVVVDPGLFDQCWQLRPNSDPLVLVESGIIGDPLCEHVGRVETTALEIAGLRTEWNCPCGAKWTEPVERAPAGFF